LIWVNTHLSLFPDVRFGLPAQPSKNRKRSSFGAGSFGTAAAINRLSPVHWKENMMQKYLFIAAAVGALAGPALADDVGVRVGPVGAGVTVGEGHRDYDRDRVREKTVIKEHEPRDRTTVIKKDHGDGVESKTVIHHDND
jgi:hypothetical protein